MCPGSSYLARTKFDVLAGLSCRSDDRPDQAHRKPVPRRWAPRIRLHPLTGHTDHTLEPTCHRLIARHRRCRSTIPAPQGKYTPGPYSDPDDGARKRDWEFALLIEYRPFDLVHDPPEMDEPPGIGRAVKARASVLPPWCRRRLSRRAGILARPLCHASYNHSAVPQQRIRHRARYLSARAMQPDCRRLSLLLPRPYLAPYAASVVNRPRLFTQGVAPAVRQCRRSTGRHAAHVLTESPADVWHGTITSPEALEPVAARRRAGRRPTAPAPPRRPRTHRFPRSAHSSACQGPRRVAMNHFTPR